MANILSNNLDLNHNAGQDEEEKLTRIKAAIKSYPGFPKPPVVFRDMFPIFLDPTLLSDLVSVLVSRVKDSKMEVDVVLGLESRGFLLAPMIALALQKPFVPVRKRGKLPGPVYSASYSLEYGTDTLELQKQSVAKGAKCLLFDDLIATGGSLEATVNLVKQCEAEPVAALLIMELEVLKGRNKLAPLPVWSLYKY